MWTVWGVWTGGGAKAPWLVWARKRRRGFLLVFHGCVHVQFSKNTRVFTSKMMRKSHSCEGWQLFPVGLYHQNENKADLLLKLKSCFDYYYETFLFKTYYLLVPNCVFQRSVQTHHLKDQDPFSALILVSHCISDFLLFLQWLMYSSWKTVKIWKVAYPLLQLAQSDSF